MQCTLSTCMACYVCSFGGAAQCSSRVARLMCRQPSPLCHAPKHFSDKYLDKRPRVTLHRSMARAATAAAATEAGTRGPCVHVGTECTRGQFAPETAFHDVTYACRVHNPWFPTLLIVRLAVSLQVSPLPVVPGFTAARPCLTGLHICAAGGDQAEAAQQGGSRRGGQAAEGLLPGDPSAGELLL